MKYANLIIIYFSFGCYCNSALAQSIIVDDSKNAQELVENILVNSTCATILNSIAGGDDFSGSSNSYGYFQRQVDNFPFVEGIVLNTSRSQNSVGPYIVNRGGGDPRWLGDVDLEQALGLTKTLNATFLEFDFVPLTNFISFNYIFASNEYQSYFPCEFSDGFAFLIKEKGSLEPYQNIAVIPNTTTAVSSTSIHPFIPPVRTTVGLKPGCSAENENFFGTYNTSSSPINYSAQTVVLNAQSIVVAGRTYQIKLVIADDENVEFDSAVFIEAGSFAPKINLGSDRTLCFGDKTILDAGLTGSTNTYEWFKDGGINVVGSNATLEVISPGQYSVRATLAVGCVATGTVNIAFKNPTLKSLTQCGDSTGNATFNLTSLTTEIISTTDDTVQYFETVAHLQNQSPTITNILNYNSASKTIYARVSNSTGCADSVSITLQVLSTSAVQKITFCDNDANQNGRRVFDLVTDVSPKIIPIVVAPLVIEGYYSIENDAINKTNSLPAIYRNNAASETIFARIENGLNCYGVIELEIQVNLYTPASPGNIKNVIINDFSGVDNSVKIETEGTGIYEYSVDGITYQSSPLFKNLALGNYTAFVRENLNCGLSSTPFYILDYPRFFTPNGDGFNDTWYIKNLQLLPKSTVIIFDRFGKLLKQSTSTAAGWNGNFNGYPLPADDYWFKLEFENGKIINGHFSLKR
ncbi:gliding motility-associated C-terminal domain-containing protein [Flavobacterium segetis]|uniref:Gliding motility-associated C-terminal domain-containing protein n=1 Tax=Flavobacterium segetis TaxID=271157 RepID=A0A1M5E6T0_9FLAO|nr:T9SS type B sorting domain-containing protein [Flavobacterium segetis]SHF74978.1 gliding motility-associated C-terminal domain-containing protein [Flavobacterium segetis]